MYQEVNWICVHVVCQSEDSCFLESDVVLFGV